MQGMRMITNLRLEGAPNFRDIGGGIGDALLRSLRERLLEPA